MTHPHAVVVEDDPLSRQLVVDLLEIHGYVVTAFPDAESLLDVAETLSPAVLIFDIRLPGMDGVALLQQIRSSAYAVSRAPCIAVTASVAISERDGLLVAGFDAYHPKPIRVHELAKLVDELYRGGWHGDRADFGGR
jgi:CheY-like chemotaxis protein